MTLSNLMTATTITTAASYNAGSMTTTFTFPNGILSDGNYSAAVTALATCRPTVRSA